MPAVLPQTSLPRRLITRLVRVQRSLVFQLVLLIGVATLLVGGVVGVIAVQNARDGILAEVLEANLASADLGAAFAATYMTDQEALIRQLATSASVRAAASRGTLASVSSELDTWLRNRTRIDSVHIVDTIGTCLAGSEPEQTCTDITPADRGWFTGLLTSGEPSLSAAGPGRTGPWPSVWYGVPVSDDQGTIQGVLAARISLASLAETLVGNQSSSGRRTGLSDLRDSVILVHPDLSRVLQRTGGQSAAGQLLRKGVRGTTENTTSQGEATLAAVAPVAGLPWGIGVIEPTSEAFESVDAMTRHASVAIAVAVVLTGLGAMSLALWLTRPLLGLRAVVNAVASGDLGRRVGGHRRDEIGQLGSAFDDMADRLQQTLAERTRLANAVGRERATLASVLASMTDGLLVLDRSGRVVYANDRAGELLALEPQTLLGKSTDEWIAMLGPSLHEPRATQAAWHQACAQSEDRPTFDMVVAAPTQRDLLVQCFPVTDGRRRRTGVLLHDVTAERELVRTRRELTSMVSHELASPATNLVAYAETLADPEVPEAERPEMLAVMVKEAQRLVSIVQDFLDIQRLEHARLQIHPQTIDLRGLLEHAASVARADSTHPVVLDIPEALPLVEVDPNRVQQVLANLVSNAQKYTPAGGQLRIIARVLTHTVEISVTDQGLGIPPEALPRLFDRFYRVETADRRSIRGTGLGLAIAKELIEANGGQIGADSAGPGLGARFWFTVPVATQADSNPPQPRPTQQDHGKPEDAVRPLRILTVDDDAMIRTALTRLLRLDGHSVRTADSSEEALVKLRSHAFDVVISDLHLSAGMTGFQLAEEVRRTWPSVRFILATGSVGTAPEEARSHGADALLIKPYRPGELRGLLHQFQPPTEQEAAA